MSQQSLGFRKQKNTHIASLAVATPPLVINQEKAKTFLLKHYSDKLGTKNLAKLRKIFAHPSVLQRHIAAENLECLVSETPDERIDRFTHWATELSLCAIHEALEKAGLTTDSVTGLVVNTCTGYICPGISTYLIEKLGLPHTIKTYDLVGSGCGGAIPNLRLCSDMLSEEQEGIVLSVSVEICSATFQMSDDLSLIVSNAIFADGASACVLWNRPEGLHLFHNSTYCEPGYREDIRYVYKNGQLHNQLSPQLPYLASNTVTKTITDLLHSNRLQIEDIQNWAFHPGGEKIINAVRNELGLSESCMQPTRKILSRYGNMSSPTIIFVLKEILERGIKPGNWCVITSFGAGLSAHCYLMRKRKG